MSGDEIVAVEGKHFIWKNLDTDPLVQRTVPCIKRASSDERNKPFLNPVLKTEFGLDHYKRLVEKKAITEFPRPLPLRGLDSEDVRVVYVYNRTTIEDNLGWKPNPIWDADLHVIKDEFNVLVMHGGYDSAVRQSFLNHLRGAYFQIGDGALGSAIADTLTILSMKDIRTAAIHAVEKNTPSSMKSMLYVLPEDKKTKLADLVEVFSSVKDIDLNFCPEEVTKEVCQ